MAEQEIQRIILGTAIISVALFALGLFGRRTDKSRRWIFILGGIICAGITICEARVAIKLSWDIAAMVGTGIVGFLTGFEIVRVGWVGWRSGDHPFCKKCGFDLFGKPKESTRCSECGADVVSDKSAVVIGQRYRRRWLLVTGILTTTIGAIVCWPVARPMLAGINWSEYKPLFWQLYDVKSKGPGSFGSYQSLQKRLASSEISESDAKKIVESVLAELEAKRSHILLIDILKLLDTQPNLLDELTVRRVMRQIGTKWDSKPTPVLVRGKKFNLQFRVLVPAWWGIQRSLRCDTRVIEDRIGDQVIRPECKSYSRPSGQSNYNTQYPLVDLGKLWEKIPPGPTTLSQKAETKVRLPYRGRELVEKVESTATANSNVVENMQLALAPPSEKDKGNVWSASVEQGSYFMIRAQVQPSVRLLSHLWIVTKSSRKDSGILFIPARQRACFWSFDDPRDIPAEPFTIELIPVTTDEITDGDYSPILDMKIVIEKINRQ